MLDSMDNPPAQMVEMYEKLKKELEKSGEKSKRLSDYSCKDDISGTWKATNGSATVKLYSDNSGQSIQYWGEYTGKANFNWSSTKSSLTFNYTSPLATKETSTGKVINKKAKNGSVSCEFGGSFLEIGGVIYRS